MKKAKRVSLLVALLGAATTILASMTFKLWGYFILT